MGVCENNNYAKILAKLARTHLSSFSHLSPAKRQHPPCVTHLHLGKKSERWTCMYMTYVHVRLPTRDVSLPLREDSSIFGVFCLLCTEKFHVLSSSIFSDTPSIPVPYTIICLWILQFWTWIWNYLSTVWCCAMQEFHIQYKGVP